MTYSSINQLALGNYLTIAFIEGVHKQISITYPEWEMVERMRVGSVDGREARFLLQTSLGRFRTGTLVSAASSLLARKAPSKKVR